MNKLLPLLLIFICQSFAFAQSPVITSAFVSNLTGTNVVDNVFVSAPSEGNSGAGQTWDFSQNTYNFYTLYSYISPSTAYGYNNFTACTDAIADSSQVYFKFQKLNGSVYSYIGESMYQSTITIYDDYKDLYRFPMSMGTTFTDTYRSHYQDSNGGIFTLTGIDTLLVDGYGTLKTPVGTFSNVLRIKVNSYSVDSNCFQGICHFGQVYKGYSYSWISESHPGLPLMWVQYVYIGGVPQRVRSEFYEWVATGIDEVEGKEMAFSISPNPNKGSINLIFGKSIPEATVAFFDITGAEVYSARLNGLNQFSINSERLPRGIYLVKVTSGEVVTTKKVVIQ
jgi:hypothetical protein